MSTRRCWTARLFLSVHRPPVNSQRIAVLTLHNKCLVSMTHNKTAPLITRSLSTSHAFMTSSADTADISSHTHSFTLASLLITYITFTQGVYSTGTLLSVLSLPLLQKGINSGAFIPASSHHPYVHSLLSIWLHSGHTLIHIVAVLLFKQIKALFHHTCNSLPVPVRFGGTRTPTTC